MKEIKINNIFLTIILIVQLVLCLTIVWDIPIARQVIGFIFLSFIPGYILLSFFRIQKLSLSKVILFSVGLSIAFLMFLGLLMNELYPIFGIMFPLSPQSIAITIITLMLVLSALIYIIKPDLSNLVISNLKVPVPTLLIFCLPVLSAVGATLLNISGNNSLSLLVICIISGLILLSVISKKIIPPRFYQATLLSIAISLLILLSFTSMYIIGYDIPLEYYVFRLTKTNFYWSHAIPFANLITSNYNAMLSISILPTIYSYMLNLNETWILKIVYPLLFSLISLGLYQLYRKQFGERLAFLSTFFFLSFSTFFDQMLGLTRQMIGELFLVLILLLLFEDKIKERKKIALSIIFGAALIVSHYAVSYLFIFIFLVSFLFLSRRNNRIEKQNAIMSWRFFFLYLIISFSWYGYISYSSPIISITNLIQQMTNSILFDFFNPSTRTSTVLQAVGMGSSSSLIYGIGRTVFQLAQFFIIVGVIKAIFKHREMKLDLKYYSMSLASMGLLLMCIILPYVASSLEMSRIYHISLIFLAPFFLLGGKTLIGWIPKLKRFALPLISILLIIFFLFQSGFVYEITGDTPKWAALSKYRIDPQTDMALYSEYMHKQDVFSIEWLSKYKEVNPKIYSDRFSHYHVLISYGMLNAKYQHDWSYLLSNTTRNVESNAYIYQGNLNVVYGIAEGPKPGLLWNITEISPFLDNCNKIYSNGGSDIYRSVS